MARFDSAQRALTCSLSGVEVSYSHYAKMYIEVVYVYDIDMLLTAMARFDSAQRARICSLSGVEVSYSYMPKCILK
jgi:hypothetical protein